MDGLRNDIGKLDEYGIKPSDYESMRIDATEKVKVVAEAISNVRKFAEPALPTGGIPKGTYEVPDINGPRPITRQNEAADLLAEKGYDITMIKPTSDKTPDFSIDGKQRILY